MKPFECMKMLGMTKPTFYRYKKLFEQMKYSNIEIVD